MLAEQFKRSPHRAALSKFLDSEAGIAFLQTLYTLRPNTVLAVNETAGRREVLALERLSEIRGYEFLQHSIQFLSQPLPEKNPGIGAPDYSDDNTGKPKEIKK